MSAFYSRHRIWIWAGIWVFTRFLTVSQVGFWNDTTGLQLEDVLTYEPWSNQLATEHVLPSGETWQYPPGAALLLLMPRLGLGVTGFGESFVALMLLFDLAGLVLLALLGRREGNYTGVWVWLLAMPMLRALSILRFDLPATTLVIASLVVIHRRPNWFGALAGLGAMIKVWPVVVLFGEWDRRRLLRACLAAAAAIGLVFAVSTVAFDGNQLGFLSEQGGRGLQLESVASTPWHLRQLLTGEPPNAVIRFGALEIAGRPADIAADLLNWATLAVLAGAGAWWLARTRAIGRGREDLADVALSRDFVFTLVLLLMVASRVLSAQYLVWMLGLAAVVLSTGGSRLVRPAWLVIGAAIVTAAAYGAAGAHGPFPIYGSPFNMVVRNLALLAAAAEASTVMVLRLRRPSAAAGRAEEVPTPAAGLQPS